MCGRFTQSAPSLEIQKRFGLVLPPKLPHRRYNLAPTDNILIVVPGPNGRTSAQALWGLIPQNAKAANAGAGLINAGVYLMEREVAETIPEGRTISLEMEVLPALVGHGLHAVVGSGPFVDMGTPEGLSAAERLLRAKDTPEPVG